MNKNIEDIIYILIIFALGAAYAYFGFFSKRRTGGISVPQIGGIIAGPAFMVLSLISLIKKIIEILGN